MSEKVVAREHICLSDMDSLSVPEMMAETTKLIRGQVSDYVSKNPQVRKGHFLRVAWEIVELEREPA